jgi:RNA polymerase-binding transcription factor DksA
MSANRAQTTKPNAKIRTSRPCPRRRLQTSRDKLSRRLEELEAGLNTAPEIEGDDPDPLIQEKTKNFALAQHFELQLETIELALQAADRGEYGICAHCGQPIAPERLRVLPETQLCVRCKSAEEKSPRRGISGRF